MSASNQPWCALVATTLLVACRPAEPEARPPSSPASPSSSPERAEPTFDAALAERLGADEYGMRKYVIAFLRAGPNRDQDEQTAAALQRAHMQNIERLAAEGKLVLAGPFMDEGELRGIYVFDVESLEEAKALTESDPAVKAGRLVMDLHPWYGSAALKEVNALHERIAEKNH